MRLLRYGPAGEERPALLDDDDRLRDLGGHLADLAGPALDPEALAGLRRLDPADLPEVPGTPRIGPPVGGIGKIVAIGWNYADHAAETGAELPEEPLVFSKAVSALAGPHDPLRLPRGSRHTDHEVELAVVIGRRTQYVSEDAALDQVAGYAVLNDVSERHYQKNRGGQFVKGKSFDGFAPLGPWLVTADAVPDPQELSLWCDVNGERRQTGSTRDMIFPVRFLISYLSRFMTLLPGDVIATGTPPGVGWGRDPQVFLASGDVVTLGIDGLGSQRIPVLAWED